MATLEELIRLLDYPTFLAEKIKDLKKNTSNSEEVDGFIFLYDQYHGDTLKIKNYLQKSKDKITRNQAKIIRFSWMKYAAIFLVILGVSTYFTLSKSPTNYYATYAEKDPGLPVFMSINKHKLDNWMLDYKDQHYKKALHEGFILTKENPTNDTINYFLGVIQLELNQPKNAYKTLKKITTESSIYLERSTFLIAICLMDINKLSAKQILEKIEHEKGFYSEKAKVILEEEF